MYGKSYMFASCIFFPLLAMVGCKNALMLNIAGYVLCFMAPALLKGYVTGINVYQVKALLCSPGVYENAR